MKYVIKDMQLHGRLFADGARFDSKEEVREQLISYHLEDESIEQGLRPVIKKMKLDEILEFGEWDIETV